jgi:FPC/CPF motif-containing protein YcgG
MEIETVVTGGQPVFSIVEHDVEPEIDPCPNDKVLSFQPDRSFQEEEATGTLGQLKGEKGFRPIHYRAA